MAKFMFVVPPLTGHINPTLGLGAELLNKGHKVAWVCIDPQLEKRLPKGADFLQLPSNMTDEEREEVKKQIMDIGKKATYGLDSLQFLYQEVLTPMNEKMIDGIKLLIDQYSPDVLINDHQMFAGAVAAIQKNIPYVTSVTAPAAIKVNEALPMVYEWESQQIIDFQKKHGIEKEERVDCSPLLNLVYTSKEFFGTSIVADSYKFVGPIINRSEKHSDFDWDKFHSMNNPVKVLISIGTTFDHILKQKYFGKIVEAFADKPIDIVIVSSPDLFATIPSNFMVCNYVPQLELISHMDIVICHAGHNTVCESLSKGKPLIVTPIAYDQSYVASCVTDSNAGIRLNFNRFKPSQMQEAVQSIITDPAYIIGAKKVQKSFKEAGGVSKAVEYLEQTL